MNGTSTKKALGQSDLVLSNLGFKAYMVEPGEDGTEEDRLVGIKSFNGYGIQINTLDATELDGTGFSRFVATLKQLKPVSMGFNIRDKNTYKRLYELAFNTSTGDEKYYKDFIFIFPKKSGWDDAVLDIRLTACISDWALDDVTTDSVQAYTVQIQGQEQPQPYHGALNTPSTTG